MIHEELDLSRWERLFSLDELRSAAEEFVQEQRNAVPAEYPNQAAVDRHVALMYPEGERITGPYDIAVVEQLRKEVFGSTLPDSRIATDIFVFNLGEPPQRNITKVGGLPYRHAQTPWPSLSNGVPLTFVGQFCFTDSHDIVGELPGEILLVFADEDGLWNDEVTNIHVEWITSEITDLVCAEDIPETGWQIDACYGSIHRTYDCQGVEARFAQYQAPYLIPILEGTKIGGVPRWIQPPVDLPGRFLCALGSIDPQPYANHSFPFINVPEPMAQSGGNYLMWGDAGSLYMSIDAVGTVFSALQSY